MTNVRTIVCVALAAAWCGAVPAQNLFTNPGFEAGNTGFLTDYTYAVSNCCAGEYTVTTNPTAFNGWFASSPPASPGSSRVMVLNGSTTPGDRVWYQNVAVTQGETYGLQVSGFTGFGGGPAVLQWQINGALIGNSTALPWLPGSWLRLTTVWVAPATGTVEVAIRNLNTQSSPNDFYIDDVSMRPCPALWWNYGTGFAGSNNSTPRIVAAADPVIGTVIPIELRGSSPTPSFGVVVWGFAPASVPSGFGGDVLVQVLAVQGLIAPAYPATTAVNFGVPNDPSLCALRVYSQFGQLDAGAAQGIALSRGLEILLGS